MKVLSFPSIPRLRDLEWMIQDLSLTTSRLQRVTGARAVQPETMSVAYRRYNSSSRGGESYQRDRSEIIRSRLLCHSRPQGFGRQTYFGGKNMFKLIRNLKLFKAQKTCSYGSLGNPVASDHLIRQSVPRPRTTNSCTRGCGRGWKSFGKHSELFRWSRNYSRKFQCCQLDLQRL